MGNSSYRKNIIIKTGAIGIVVNILLVLFKSVIGALSGSIAIILDAVNNFSDVLSSAVTIVGMKLAGKPADKRHPFGHGRIEYVTTMAVAVIIVMAGAGFFIESCKKTLSPSIENYNTVQIIIIAVTVLVKIFLGLYVLNRGKKASSASLDGIGRDALFDALITSCTLIAAIAVTFFGNMVKDIPIDGILGIFISIIIIRSGISMLSGPVNELLGVRIEGAVIQKIKSDFISYPNISGAYDLILHKYGQDSTVGSINIEVPDTMTANEIFVLTRRMHRDMLKKYGIYFTIGIYAKNENDPLMIDMKSNIISIASSIPGIIQIHGLYIDDTDKIISFDTVVDFNIKDSEALKQELTTKINVYYPDYMIDNTIDTDFSTTD